MKLSIIIPVFNEEKKYYRSHKASRDCYAPEISKRDYYHQRWVFR